MPPSRRQLDPRDMKSAYVVSDENGYYDSQNIINVYDKFLGKQVLSCVLHHSRNHEGGKGEIIIQFLLINKIQDHSVQVSQKN